MNPTAMEKLREIIRLKQLRGAILQVEGTPVPQLELQGTHALNKLTEKIQELTDQSAGHERSSVTLNERQNFFVESLLNGEPVALTGPAGSGKTTSVKEAIRRLLASGKIPPLQDVVHKHLKNGTPGVACIAFTNKAVENMKKVLPADLRGNCITIHKILEFQPEYFETMDEESGNMKKTMQFVPSRHAGNPLPKGLKTLFIDEATMVGVELWNLLADAIQHHIQIVLIGDIQQLPPVFGKPIFIYAMQHGVTKVELTEVHRQALESPIISLAHKILGGKQIPLKDLESLNYDGKHGVMKVIPWKKKLGDTGALRIMQMKLPEWIDAGEYDPMEDVILTCFNVNFGCIELNKIVASHLATVERRKLNQAIASYVEGGSSSEVEAIEERCKVHEIIAGINKKYFRVGDKVLYNKTEHFITGIAKNGKYFGKLPRMASASMDYNGIESDQGKAFQDDAGHLLDKSDNDIDDFLAGFASMGGIDDDDKAMPRSASHIITLYSEELGQTETLDTSGEIGKLELGYAITVHKSQGSEYRRVFFITHETQATMHFRELIYTAVTRAKEELIVVCPPALFVKGINTQKLPGKTLEDKLIAFERMCQLQKGSTAQQPLRLDLFKKRESLEGITYGTVKPTQETQTIGAPF